MADAVVIATPDRCHYENTLCALDAGYKNVLLEKPIATSVSHCIEIVERANKSIARRRTIRTNSVEMLDGIFGWI